MQEINCSKCNGKHLTSECPRFCRRCNENYENCDCMEYFVRTGRYSMARTSRGSSVRIIKSLSGSSRHAVGIEIGEDETHDGLRNLISEALNLRDCLLRYQGPWLGGGKNQFLDNLESLNRAGTGAADLAEGINKRIYEALVELVVLERSIPENFDTHEDERMNVLDEITEYDSRALKFHHAQRYLTLLGMEEPQATKEINDILNNIRKALPEDYGPDSPMIEMHVLPVDEPRIKSKLVNWRKSKKAKVLQDKKTQTS